MRLAAKPAKIVKRAPAGPPLSTRKKIGLMAAVVIGNIVLVFVVVAILVKFFLHKGGITLP